MAGVIANVSIFTIETTADICWGKASLVTCLFITYQYTLWWTFQMNGPRVQAIINTNVVFITAIGLLQGTTYAETLQEGLSVCAAALLYTLLGLYIAYTPDGNEPNQASTGNLP